MDKNYSEKSHILIVDDTVQNIQILGTLLKQEKYQINVAQNGMQALEIASKMPLDLILLDVMMPELDGFSTCKHLKQMPETADIPVIFLTAKTELNNIIKGFQLGAVDYITKPFNPMELIARVRTQLDLKHSRDMIQSVSQERMELLHILCHDLANPVSAILSLIRLSTQFEDPKRMLGLMESAAENALNIIHLVRKMRQLEEQGLQLQCVSLARMIEDSYQILAQRFTEKQLVFSVHIPPNLHIVAEPVSLINSVFNNLLTNAIKFSYREGEVIVKACKIADHVELTIQDQGMGIPPSLLENLFDIGHTTSRAGTEGEEGTGFGMPLVKKFMHAYGGEIYISSQEKKKNPDHHGTLITLIFPLAIESSA